MSSPDGKEDIRADMEFSPIRPLQEFLLETNRFQIPEKNMERVLNRILNNLMYYQTNYILVITCGFVLIGLCNPKEVLLGGFALAVAAVVFIYAFSKHEEAANFKRDHPLVSLGLIVGAAYLVVSVSNAVISFLFAIALPMLFMFIHAGLRMRSIKNKMNAKLELTGCRRTPMGRLLHLLDLEPQLIRGID